MLLTLAHVEDIEPCKCVEDVWQVGKCVEDIEQLGKQGFMAVSCATWQMCDLFLQQIF